MTVHYKKNPARKRKISHCFQCCIDGPVTSFDWSLLNTGNEK